MRCLLPMLAAAAIALAGCGKQEPVADPAATDTPAAPAPAAAPTTAMGEQVFKRCLACHTIAKDGGNGVGPNLHSVVDRAVASRAGYAYSAAMKAKGGSWDTPTLDAYLKRPMMALPGTKMAFAGIHDDADRAALILYLAAQTD